jgi:hypothetical protein
MACGGSGSSGSGDTPEASVPSGSTGDATTGADGVPASEDGSRGPQSIDGPGYFSYPMEVDSKIVDNTNGTCGCDNPMASAKYEALYEP